MTGTPPPTLKPMSTFDPTAARAAARPAQRQDHCHGAGPEESESWREHANPHSEGVIEWDGLLLDGWCEPLGG